MYSSKSNSRKTCWNKGKLVGQKLPLKLEEIWLSIDCFFSLLYKLFYRGITVYAYKEIT